MECRLFLLYSLLGDGGMNEGDENERGDGKKKLEGDGEGDIGRGDDEDNVRHLLNTVL